VFLIIFVVFLGVAGFVWGGVWEFPASPPLPSARCVLGVVGVVGFVFFLFFGIFCFMVFLLGMGGVVERFFCVFFFFVGVVWYW